jgi:hypothetical protein
VEHTDARRNCSELPKFANKRASSNSRCCSLHPLPHTKLLASIRLRLFPLLKCYTRTFLRSLDVPFLSLLHTLGAAFPTADLLKKKKKVAILPAALTYSIPNIVLQHWTRLASMLLPGEKQHPPMCLGSGCALQLVNVQPVSCVVYLHM